MPAIATSKAGRREWIGLGVLALPTLLVSMDLTVLFLAVPSLSAELKPSGAQLLWITDIYGFLLAASLITMGTLGDRIGSRRLLLIGAAAFGAMSILAALSSSAEMLIVSRALLGVAAATLLPSTLALIRNMFLDPVQRTRAIGLWTSVFSLGGLLGPLVGGAMIEQHGWASVFLMGVPVMLLLVMFGPALLPEFRDACPGRFDFVSALLSLCATLIFVYGIKRVAQDDMRLASLSCIVAGLALGLLFVRRQLAVVDPLMDLRLFSVPDFTAALGANMVAIFAWMGTLLFISQYLQLVRGWSPFVAGLLTIPSAMVSVFACLLASACAQKCHSALALSIGLAIMAIGLYWLGEVSITSGTAVVVSATMLISGGAAIVLTLGTDIVMTAAGAEQAGAASALSETCTEIGGAFGIATLGSIGAAMYRDALFDTSFAGMPLDLSHASRATLAGTMETARLLPVEASANLVHGAREAFVSALKLATAIGMIAVLATIGAIGIYYLRRAWLSKRPTR